jgi:hypothetical protein
MGAAPHPRRPRRNIAAKALGAGDGTTACHGGGQRPKVRPQRIRGRRFGPSGSEAEGSAPADQRPKVRPPADRSVVRQTSAARGNRRATLPADRSRLTDGRAAAQGSPVCQRPEARHRTGASSAPNGLTVLPARHRPGRKSLARSPARPVLVRRASCLASRGPRRAQLLCVSRETDGLWNGGEEARLDPKASEASPVTASGPRSPWMWILAHLELFGRSAPSQRPAVNTDVPATVRAVASLPLAVPTLGEGSPHS